MKKSILSVIALTLLTSSLSTAAVVTVLDTTTDIMGSITLGNFGEGSSDQDPLGQSFVLSQALTSLTIGAFLVDVNSHLAPELSVMATLVSGTGVGGPVLASRSVVLPADFNEVHLFDFSSLGALGPGTYTAVFSTSGVGRGALGVAPNLASDSAPYNEFGEYSSDIFPDNDFGVLVQGETIVPEPASAVLTFFGLAGVIAVARRRQARVAYHRR